MPRFTKYLFIACMLVVLVIAGKKAYTHKASKGVQLEEVYSMDKIYTEEDIIQEAASNGSTSWQRVGKFIRNHTDLSPKSDPAFHAEGIEHIALVTMVKDEHDIIFENLAWHFALGFRKFIVVDNRSTDGTSELIEKFSKLVDGHADVFIIKDPIIPHIQSRIITGSYHFAQFVWPEVEWVFPVDGDEFWYPRVRLDEILAKIPERVNHLLSLSTYYGFDTTKGLVPDNPGKFYEGLTTRDVVFWDHEMGKSAVRVSRNLGIEQGSHRAYLLNESEKLRYAAGDVLGLNIRSHSLRSLEQIKSKLINGAKANLLGKELGIINDNIGKHWDTFLDEIQEEGNVDIAARKRLQTMLAKPSNNPKFLYDPLPIKEALTLFYDIINTPSKDLCEGKVDIQ